MENSEGGDPILEFESIKKHATEYIKNRLNYFKLTAIEYIAKLAPSFVFTMVLTLILLVFWVFLNVFAAISIGNTIHDSSEGFLIVSGVNLVLAIIIIVARKALIFKPVTNWLIKTLVKSMEADENK